MVIDRSEDKRMVWEQRPFDVIFKGDDWQGTPKGYRLERTMGEIGVDVVYYPYTRQTSSTMLRAHLTGAELEGLA